MERQRDDDKKLQKPRRRTKLGRMETNETYAHVQTNSRSRKEKGNRLPKSAALAEETPWTRSFPSRSAAAKVTQANSTQQSRGTSATTSDRTGCGFRRTRVQRRPAAGRCRETAEGGGGGAPASVGIRTGPGEP